MIHYKNITVQTHYHDRTVVKWYKLGIEQNGTLIVTKQDMTSDKFKLGKSIWHGQQITEAMFMQEANKMTVKHDERKNELRDLKAYAVNEHDNFLSGNISMLRQLKQSNDEEYHSLKEDVLKTLKTSYKELSCKDIWKVVKSYIKKA